MKLYLNDIKNFAFKSSSKRYIRPEIICDDGYIVVTELHSKSWSRWDLSNYKQDVNDACVYFLLNENEVVYIGQTTKENRPFAHEKDKEFTDVYFIPVKYPYNLKLEQNLLSKYTTKYNKQYYKRKILNIKTSSRSKFDYIHTIYNSIPDVEYTNREIVNIFSRVWKKDNVNKMLKDGSLFKKVRHGVYVKHKNKL